VALAGKALCEIVSTVVFRILSTCGREGDLKICYKNCSIVEVVVTGLQWIWSGEGKGHTGRREQLVDRGVDLTGGLL